MSDYTWKQAFKDIPKTFKQGCINTYNYWRKASLRMWVAETLWLIILVAMFYYGLYGTIEFFHTTTINPHSALGWFVSFLPLWLVFGIFIVHWIFSSAVRIVFKWLDGKPE